MDGLNFITRIDSTLEAQHKTRAWLASEMGLSVQQFTDWKRRKIPAGDTCLRLAQLLGVSVEWLISGTPPVPAAIPEGLEKFFLLSKEHKSMITAMIDALLAQEEQSLTLRSAMRTG